jgi:hypothetical protein
MKCLRAVRIVLIVVVSVLPLTAGLLIIGMVPVPMGGGQGEQSPDKQCDAIASVLRNENPLAIRGREPYYEFLVRRGYTQVVHRAVLDPAAGAPLLDFRQLPKVVYWKEDSSEVTFRIPNITLVFTLPRDVPNTERQGQRAPNNVLEGTAR